MVIRGVRCPGTRVTADCELLYGPEPNPSPLQEQQALLTGKPSLQSPYFNFFIQNSLKHCMVVHIYNPIICKLEAGGGGTQDHPQCGGLITNGFLRPTYVNV